MECTRHYPLPSVIPGEKVDIFTTKLMTYVACQDMWQILLT